LYTCSLNSLRRSEKLQGWRGLSVSPAAKGSRRCWGVVNLGLGPEGDMSAGSCFSSPSSTHSLPLIYSISTQLILCRRRHPLVPLVIISLFSPPSGLSKLRTRKISAVRRSVIVKVSKPVEGGDKEPRPKKAKERSTGRRGPDEVYFWRSHRRCDNRFKAETAPATERAGELT